MRVIMRFIFMRSKIVQKHAVAIALFLILGWIYSISIPDRFNTVYENRRFFDSDGEFITRQFRQGKTFTHNDHLLYHVLATVLYRNAPFIPGLVQDPVAVHKPLSVVAGSVAVVFLYYAGLALGASTGMAVAGALLAGGCAGWWFFSATIDTYMPSLAASCLALWAILEWVRAPRIAWLLTAGVGAGLAFLFRTDGFLLAPLGLALLAHRTTFWRNAAILAAVVALVGAGGYVWLAQRFYNVPPAKVADWALHGMKRPEAKREKIWGVAKNLTAKNFRRVIANHVFYTVLIPHVEGTADTKTMRHYLRPRALAPLLLYLGATGWGLAGWARRMFASSSASAALIAGLALMWILPRIIFYTWWNPFEPFLFAVMSIPGWWLLWISGAASLSNSRWYPVCFWAACFGVWMHNLYTMILPFNAL